jgi:hypothetical protein
MGELLKKLVLENTVPYNTPLPLLYYRERKRWFRRREKYYTAFIVFNEERRLLVEDPEIIIGSPRQVGVRAVKIIEKIWLDYLGGLQEEDTGLIRTLTINLANLGHLLKEMGMPSKLIYGDTRWVNSGDFENSEFREQLMSTMIVYLHLEISPYEKYNPKWWKKESRKLSLNTGTSELVKNLRKSGVLEKRGLEEDALETLLYLNPDPTLLRLIIDFALGEEGRYEFELWLSKNSNENKSISVVPKE